MKKGTVTVNTNETTIGMSKSIGMPQAIIAGVTIGLCVARFVYGVYRDGVGAGVQSMLDNCKECAETVEAAAEEIVQ